MKTTRTINDIPSWAIEKIRTDYVYNLNSGELKNIKTGNTNWSITRGYYRLGIGRMINYQKEHHSFKLHQIAFILIENRIPECIDHINGIKTDNRWCNLRECGQLENNKNRGKSISNKTGYKGVELLRDVTSETINKYKASIRSNNKKIYLGVYPTAEDAARAYDISCKMYHGDFANLNFPEENK